MTAKPTFARDEAGDGVWDGVWDEAEVVACAGDTAMNVESTMTTSVRDMTIVLRVIRG